MTSPISQIFAEILSERARDPDLGIGSATQAADPAVNIISEGG
jgi:hypothetical protein